MGNVILFPVLNRNQRGKQIPEFDQPVARCSQGEGFVPSSENIKKHWKIEEIEEPDEDAVPDLSELEQIIIFSPEIQQEGFVKLPTSGEKQAPRQWGDVFLKAGDEYPFLFTVYTANYAKTQFQYYGERILPSLKDVILNKEHLDPKDIIRAVIKWVNIYCPTLLGKPISLEKDSILQTPPVEFLG